LNKQCYFNLPGGIPECSSGVISAKSGNPELHSGLPCSVALGFPRSLTLSCAPVMCPLQRPRPSPPADDSIRLPGSGPCERRDVRGTELAGNLKKRHSLIH
ncbi:unnamed protein product, partial [Staurois parvus]